MTGSAPSVVQRLRDLLPHLGLDAEHLLVPRAELPDHLQESSLQAWSYAPDFTPLVQHLLQLRRGGRCLSIAVCGPEAASTARAFTAVQLGVGFAQHGLRTVIVDADVTQPGLGGLVTDPHQEGLVDMVRFGRSCRALLRTPVADGPAILGIGSFPVEGPAPFDGDSWLGILHRVAVHAEVSLFVGPLYEGAEPNPLAQAADQVLYVPAAENGSATEREVERLRRSDARVAAVVLWSPSVSASPPLRMPVELDLPEVEPIAPVAPVERFGTRELELPPIDFPPADLPSVEFTVEPTTEPLTSSAFEVGSMEPPVIEPAPPSLEVERPAAETPRRNFPPPPAWGEEPIRNPPVEPVHSDLDLEPVGVVEATSAQAAARSTEEANQLRQRLQLDAPDFSYSDGGKSSRLPLYMFTAVVLTIGGFLGWALWSQREINRRAQEILAGASEPGDQQTAPPKVNPPVQPPSDEKASRSTSGAPPDDEAAAAKNTSTAKPPPRGSETPQGTGNSAVEPSGSGRDSAPKESTPVRPEPPPVVPTPPKPPASGGTGNAKQTTIYAVHVASYRKLEQANQDLANLRKSGYDGRAVRTDLGSKGIWYRVYVGSYPTKEAATAAREKIVKLPGYDAFAQVRRIAVP